MDGKIIQEPLTQQGASLAQMCTIQANYGTDKIARLYCPFIPRLVVFQMINLNNQSIYMGCNNILTNLYRGDTLAYTYSDSTIAVTGMGVSTTHEYTLTAFG